MPETTSEQTPTSGKSARYQRARLRHMLMTTGPNRLSRGRLGERHLRQPVKVRHRAVTTGLWPTAFDGLRIGHVTDFHLGDLLPVETAVKVIERLARKKPDLVACTGDVIDLRHEGAEPVFEALAAIDAPLGSYFVLGNHDELQCADTLTDMAQRAGVTVLRNRRVEVERDGQRLVIGGIDWARRPRRCAALLDRLSEPPTHLLLAHNPKVFRFAARRGIALTLAGHTHGGQIALRRRPNANLALSHRRSAGLFHLGDSTLHVSTGIGAWFPLRVNCPPEIAMITVKSADGASSTA